MADNRVIEMQRLRFWQGQRLLSRDFRDQTTYESQLRWWHNRALHNSFGVSYGYGVTLSNGRIQIDCGVAYDCYGRELILQSPREILLPPAPVADFKKMTLVASFKTADQPTSDCSGKRLEPWFEWKPSDSMEIVDGVPIAEITYEPSAPLESLPANLRFPALLAQRVFYDPERKLLIAIDGLKETEAADLELLSSDAAFVAAIDKLAAADERSPVLNAHFIVRHARALTRPRMESGATVPGDTAWELWSEGVVDPRGIKNQADLGIQVTIDTSGAGFTEVPCYFAWLQGTLWNQVHLNFFPVPITHIDRESTRSFRFRLWMPSIITVLGKRIRFANVEPEFAADTGPVAILADNTIVGRNRVVVGGTGTADGPPVERTVEIRKTNKELSGFATDFVNFARQQKLYICWMGIQEMIQPQCEPFADCQCNTKVEVAKVAERKTAKMPGRRKTRPSATSRRRFKGER